LTDYEQHRVVMSKAEPGTLLAVNRLVRRRVPLHPVRPGQSHAYQYESGRYFRVGDHPPARYRILNARGAAMICYRSRPTASEPDPLCATQGFDTAERKFFPNAAEALMTPPYKAPTTPRPATSCPVR
jgi:hypothetical protein